MYVQLDADYYDHPKTLHLVSLIGPEADVYPPRLWTWAMKYAKKGVLRSNSMLEVACRWRGEPGKLATAMMAAGFVDMDGLTIHGWMERTGHDLEVYEQKKERFRERRRNIPGTFRERSRTVTEQLSEHSALTDLSGTERSGTELNGAEVPSATLAVEASSPTSPESQLIQVAEQQRVIAKPDTLRRYVTGWVSDRGFEYSQRSLMDPWSRGKDVLSIHDRFFRVNGNGKNHGPPISKPKKADPDCQKCGGSGRRDNPSTGGKMDCTCLR